MKRHALTLLAAVLALTALPAAAHPFHEAGAGFVAGFAHPFLGLDHLLAMIAVGLWAAQSKGPSAMRAPLTFVGMMLAGGMLGMAGLSGSALEPLIAASVLTLGLMVALRQSLESAALLLIAAFALCHGIAHGLEMPATVAALPFAAGFISATALLHLGGMAAGHQLGVAARWAGAPIAIMGGWMLVSGMV